WKLIDLLVRKDFRQANPGTQARCLCYHCKTDALRKIRIASAAHQNLSVLQTTRQCSTGCGNMGLRGRELKIFPEAGKIIENINLLQRYYFTYSCLLQHPIYIKNPEKNG
ncbi:MAG: hypothetical protein WCP55_24940, partial [Lentisphaerota bacterium]